MLKVMIADDEERICQLIKALVDWKSLDMEVVGIANNGLEAGQMVQTLHPDILITDIRMPGCNGLELIENVKESVTELEIIIISGYAHFAYAQTAIKFGVGDYLLKPINKEELTSTLCKLKQRIEARMETEQNTRQLKQKSANDIRRLQQNLLDQLLAGKEVACAEQTLRDEYYLEVAGGYYQAFCVKIDSRDMGSSQADTTTVLEKVQSLLEGSLGKRCTKLLTGCHGSSCIGFLNYTEEKQEQIRRVIRDCLNQLESGRGIYGSVTFTAALGCAVREPEELRESFREMTVIIEERLLKGTGRLYDRMPGTSGMGEQNLLEKYLRLTIHAIEVMSVHEAEAAVNDMKLQIVGMKDVRGCDIKDLVHSAANIFLSQVEVVNRAEELQRFSEQCEMCGSAEELFAKLSSLQERYLEAMSRKHESDTARPIRLAKQYIQNHYTEPITQEEVSNAVGLSAAYFSVLFKKVEGEGFAKYLINVRIEQAKRLLRESNIPVSKVCQQVGYNDLKHFTHTFEKATGVKPTVYRKLYG